MLALMLMLMVPVLGLLRLLLVVKMQTEGGEEQDPSIYANKRLMRTPALPVGMLR